MSKMEQLFKDEKLLEKVVSAESREDAKKACKAGGVELSDSDLDEIAGGLNKITKRVLQILGIAATAATAAAGVGVAGKKLGWWGKSQGTAPAPKAIPYVPKDDQKNPVGCESEFIDATSEGMDDLS